MMTLSLLCRLGAALRCLLPLAGLLPQPALALTPGATAGAGDIAFYTFTLSAAAFSAAIIAAYRQPKWLAYVLLTVLLALNAAAQDGMLAQALGETDFVLWALPFIITTAVTTYGYWLVAARLEIPHALVRFRRPSLILAVVSGLLCVSSALWLKRIPLTAMWVPANALFFGMLLAQTLPPLTWQTPDPGLRRIIRAFPVVLGGVAVAVYLGHWLAFDFDRATLNQINRGLMVLVAVFALTIVIWQAFAAAREKVDAERRVLEAAKAEADLQLALVRAERDYERARALAERHRTQLASVSHDLKQPITALRIAIDDLQREAQGTEADKLDRAVDYIDSLARAYLDEELAAGPRGGAVDDSPAPARETVSTLIFAAMLRQMFADDAARRGVDLRVRATEAWVCVDPLPTMRVMTNLIGNALAHAAPTRILVTFRQRTGQVCFQVRDNGRGMDADMLARVGEPGVRGDTDSDGHGLGLGIVQALCDAGDMRFTLASAAGCGTCATIIITRVAPPA
ncbi:HAMP domain-containing sensor histidine kinase [Zoogloeaceae bacterium G21618-S1]|nr:HAMP domain-containing sensor histidine kinase [Zoogloeaceae bacterium G21618-S1]